MYAEVRLRTGSDLSGITILRNVSGLTFDAKNGDVGAISFNIPLADATALGVDANSVIEVQPNGKAAPNLWFGMESSQGSQTADGASLLALSGKSLVNWLADGMVYPSTWHYAVTPADYSVSTTGSRTIVVPRFYINVAASVTFQGTPDTVTTPTNHNLSVNDSVQFATITTTTGILTNRVYYVKSTPTTTTFTLSATVGGATINLVNNGTGTGLTKNVTSSDTSQTTIGGHAFENATPGFIMRTLIARSVERNGMGWLDVSSFTGTTSSAGNPWNTTLTTQYSTGTTLLQVIQDLSARNLIEFRMDGNSLKVYNLNESTTHYTADQITFRRGKQITEQTRTKDSSNTADTVLIAGDALAIGEINDSATTSALGRRREKYVSQSGITDIPTLVNLMGGAELSITGHILVEDTLGIADNDILPWINFQVGDWVWADFDGTLKNIQVQQISASQQDANTYQIGLTLGDLISAQAIKNQRLLDNITGGSGSNYGGLPNQVTGRPPSDPSAVTATATAYRDANGLDLSQVTVTWTQPTTNIDGTTLTDLNRYELQYRLNGSTIWTDSANIPASNAIIAGFLSNLPSGATFVCRVRAVNEPGYASNWVTSNTITLPKMVVTPATPSTPTVVPVISGVAVYWNGLDNTASFYDSSWLRTDIYVSLSSTFTPSPSTLAGTFSSQGGAYQINNLVYGNTYYVKLVTYDKSGNVSVASAVSTGAAPLQVSTVDIATNSINATMIQNAVITGAKIANGTVSVNNLTVSAFGDSVAPNGSFEEATTNSADLTGAAGWTFATWPGSAGSATSALDSSGTNSNAGSNAVSLTIPAGTSGGVIGLSVPIPTSNPDVWFVTFKVKSSATLVGRLSVIASLGNTPAEANNLTHSANGTNIFGSLVEPMNSATTGATTFNTITTYRNWEVGFTVPANGAGLAYKYMNVYLGVPVGASLASPITLYFDQVSVRPVGGSATITNLTASKITAGTLGADVVVGSRIKTADTGARVELNSSGLQAFDASNNLTLQASSATGAVYMQGQLDGGSISIPQSFVDTSGHFIVDSLGPREAMTATTNLVLNPNFQNGLVGVTAGSGTCAITAGAPISDYAGNLDLVPKYGRQALKAHSGTAGSTFSLAIGTLVAGQTYALSWYAAAGRVDDTAVLANTNGDFSKITIKQGATTVKTGTDGFVLLPISPFAGLYQSPQSSGIGTTAFFGWQTRFYMIFTATTSGVHTLNLPYPVTTGGTTDTVTALHIGGVQCENHPYVTRYVDGDMTFGTWAGTRGASTSSRADRASFWIPPFDDPYYTGNMNVDQVTTATLKLGSAPPHGANYSSGYKVSNAAIPTSTWTPIAYDLPTTAQRSAQDDGTIRPNLYDFVAPVDGMYTFMFTTTFSNSSTAGNRWMRLRYKTYTDLTGNELARTIPLDASLVPSNLHVVTLTGCVWLGANYTVHVEVYQNSGGNLNLLANSSTSPNLYSFALMAGT